MMAKAWRIARRQALTVNCKFLVLALLNVSDTEGLPVGILISLLGASTLYVGQRDYDIQASFYIYIID